MLTKHKAANIVYTKEVGGSGDINRFEETKRTIIPTFIPPTNVKALDVTGFSKDEVVVLEDRLNEYADYYKTAVKTIFSFDDWLAQTHQETTEVKWRTFKQDGITEQ